MKHRLHLPALEIKGITNILAIECSNDVYDSDTGADKNKKESVVNLVGRYCLLPIPNRNNSKCLHICFRSETFTSVICCAVEQ